MLDDEISGDSIIEITDEIIKLFIYGKEWQCLDNFDGVRMSLNNFKNDNSMYYMGLRRDIKEIFRGSLIGENDNKNLTIFLKSLKVAELFYFIKYITPIRNLKRIGGKEKSFFYDSVNYYNFDLINIFNRDVFVKDTPDERVRALIGILENLNDASSYSTMTKYGESLYHNFYTTYILREVYHYEGEFVNKFIFFMDHNRDMFLYYILKIYNLNEIVKNLPQLKNSDFNNDTYRLLYERCKTLGDSFYDMPLEWHLELVRN